MNKLITRQPFPCKVIIFCYSQSNETDGLVSTYELQFHKILILVSFTQNWFISKHTLNSHVLFSRLCLAMHHRTYLTTYIWSRKGLDVACICLLIDRVLFHAHTTHSVTEVSLSRGNMSGIASQDTYAMRISPTATSGVN